MKHGKTIFSAGESEQEVLEKNELNDELKDESKKEFKYQKKGTIRDKMDDLRNILKEEILKGEASEEEKNVLLERLKNFCDTKTNIMLVGATGCGKSSTINALFAAGEQKKDVSESDDNNVDGKHADDCDDNNASVHDGKLADDCDDDNSKTASATIRNFVQVAKVGSKADPETKDIEKYTIGNLILWDTPGLGDGTEIDEHHKQVITELLRKKDEDGNALIDLVLVILDGSSRDLGTSYKILNDVIIPELKDDTSRILVALNQADIAMKTGRHWDYEKNEPDETLIKFLEEKVQSIKTRIKNDSNLEIEPVYYCAGYIEEGGDVVRPYNLSKLLYYILKSLPTEKRGAIMEGINTDSDNYEYNDDDEDYNEEIKENFCDYIDYISEGVDTGADIGGALLGLPGAVIGATIGGFCGCVRSILVDLADIWR